MSASMLCRSLPFHISVFLSRCIFDFSCSLARILRYVWFYFNAQTVDESAFYYENFSSYCSQELSDFGRCVFISLVNSVAAYLLEAVGVGFSAFLFPDLDFDTIDTFQGFLDCLDRPVVKGTVLGTGVWHAGEIKGRPVVQEAYEMGKNV